MQKIAGAVVLTGGNIECVDHVARLEASLGRRRIGPDRDDVGAGPDSKGRDRPHRRARRPARQTWSVGGCRRGSRSGSPSAVCRPRRSRSTSKVIGLPALAKQIPGNRIGSKSSCPLTLTIRSPLRNPAFSAGESLRMPLIGSISSRRPKSTKWFAGRVSSNCSVGGTVVPGGQERPAFDHVLDRPVEVPGERRS